MEDKDNIDKKKDIWGSEKRYPRYYSESDYFSSDEYLDFGYSDEYYTNPWVNYSKRSSYGDYYKDRFSSGSSYYVSRYSRGSMSSFITSSYSRSLESGEDIEKRRTTLFDKSLKLTREFISILSLPFSISIYISEGISEIESTVVRNCRRIFLPTIAFDEISDKTDEEVINTVVGQGLHEAAHLKFSELSYFNSIDKDDYDPKKEILVNILEDERVDRLLISERPGYSDFISQAKKYKLESSKVEIKSLREDDKLLYDVMCFLRFPNILDESTLSTRGDLFNKIKDILKTTPLVRPIDVFKMADELLSIINLEISKLDCDKKSNYKKLKKLYVPLLYGKDSESATWIAPSDFITEGVSGHSTAAIKFAIDMKLSMGLLEKGEDKTTYFCVDTVEDDKEYLKIKNQILKFVPQIRKKLITLDKNYAFNIYGCRSGLLDTTKLVEAYQSVPQVYIREGTVTTNKVSVCILIDESGSMGYCSRYYKAKQAAILLYEALSGMSGVEVYIYGHTADQVVGVGSGIGVGGGSTDIRVYVEPGNDRHKSLVDIRARWENRDGTAILECAKRVRKKTKNKCIMFVLSDGEPAAYRYYGESAISDTAKKVKQAENLGFEVIQITIDGSISSTKKMFSKYIDLKNDLDQLPEKMGKIIKDFIIENKTSTITS